MKENTRKERRESSISSQLLASKGSGPPIKSPPHSADAPTILLKNEKARRKRKYRKAKNSKGSFAFLSFFFSSFSATLSCVCVSVCVHVSTFCLSLRFPIFFLQQRLTSSIQLWSAEVRAMRLSRLSTTVLGHLIEYLSKQITTIRLVKPQLIRTLINNASER